MSKRIKFKYDKSYSLTKQRKSLTTRTIRERALAIGLPHQATTEFLHMWNTWVEASGEEWAVKRMKQLRTDLFQMRTEGGYQPAPWFKALNGQYTGIIGYFFKEAAASRRQYKKVLKLFSIYTAYIAEEATESQCRKFYDSMTKIATPIAHNYLHMGKQAVIQATKDGYLVRPYKVKPASEFLTSALGKESHEKRTMDEIFQFFSTSYGTTLRGYYRSQFECMDSCLTTTYVKHWDELPTLGKIHLLQEPGYKGRFVLAPRVFLQHVLTPMWKIIDRNLPTLPWDCTHDQARADGVIQQALIEGKTVYCVDLSDATNVFSLEFQKEVLYELFKYDKSWVDLLYDLVKLPCVGHDGILRTFGTGQPLGLKPSFAMFAMSHGLLVYALNEYKHEGKFYILGDDIVILDKQLADKYKQALNDLQIPWAPDKTLESSLIAEFAGKVFTADEIYNKPKWTDWDDTNLLSIAKLWGPEVLKWNLGKDRKEFLEFLAALPEPIGFGWNSKGLSLDSRLAGLDSMLWPEKETKGAYELCPFKTVHYRLSRVHESIMDSINPQLLISVAKNAITRAEQAIRAELDKLNTLIPSDPEYAPNLYFMDDTLKIASRSVLTSNHRNREQHARLPLIREQLIDLYQLQGLQVPFGVYK